MFDIFKDLEKLQDRVYLNKLVKKKDIKYEVNFQSKEISDNGDKIIDITTEYDMTIIIYRNLYELPENEEYTIDLNLRVITLQGVVYPEPRLFAFKHHDYIHLSDIRIFGKNQNKGYGTILLNKLKEIATKTNINKIYGQISSVDSDHIDRLLHFYKKNNFAVDDMGRVEWNSNQIIEFKKEGIF